MHFRELQALSVAVIEGVSCEGPWSLCGMVTLALSIGPTV